MTDPVQFTVAAPEPHTHLFEVEMEVPELGGRAELDLQMPVWTPGSYLVREYARHLRTLEARTPDGQARRVEKVDKATWRIDTSSTDRIVVDYEIYAHSLGVREKHLDGTHGFYNGTALYLYPKDELDRSVELHVEPPFDDWDVYCPLPEGDARQTWRADDFEMLFDAPVEMGDHETLTFEVEGTEHTVAFWGEGNWDRERLERDLPAIVEANSELFGGLPYDDYLFITLLTDSTYGGLEHRNSTALTYPQNAFGAPPEDASNEPPLEDDDYQNFLSLVAHEHFHVWNVKRLKPQALDEIDYQRENYLRELWTIEGVTSYYDTRALLRSGRIDDATYLDDLADAIARYEQTPGRKIQSIEEAGFDAWIKYYRRDEQTLNSTISYYLKGSLVVMLLDLRIRRETGGEYDFDDALLHLWQHYWESNGEGFPEGAYESIASELADTDLSEFFDAHVRGTEPIEWNDHFEPLGLRLERERDDDSPESWLGVRTRSDAGAPEVRSIPDGSPASDRDVHPGDQLVALDGWRLSNDDGLEERLQLFEPGETIEVHLFRRGRLRSATVELGRRPADDYTLELRDDATERQRQLLRDWLATDELSI
jgi:predicted metalloprotease with PDZ domain